LRDALPATDKLDSMPKRKTQGKKNIRHGAVKQRGSIWRQVRGETILVSPRCISLRTPQAKTWSLLVYQECHIVRALVDADCQRKVGIAPRIPVWSRTSGWESPSAFPGTKSRGRSDTLRITRIPTTVRMSSLPTAVSQLQITEFVHNSVAPPNVLMEACEP